MAGGMARAEGVGIPDITIGARGGFEASPSGRPLDPGLRMQAIVAVLDADGVVPSAKALRAMWFWEAAIAGMVGDPGDDDDHVLDPDGPRSPTMEATEARLAAAGAFVDDSGDDPDLIPGRHGRTGAVASWMRAEPPTWSPWFRALHEFAYGLHDTEPAGIRLGVAPVDDGSDLLRMLAVDPIAGALTPGVRAGGAIAEGGRAFLDVVRRARAGSGHARTEPHHAAWVLARHLCAKSRAADPRFGDGEFLAHLAASSHVETADGDGVATSTFRDAEGAEGAVLRYRPGKDGCVLSIDVPEAMRRRGFGTLALRHAMRTGVTATEPVPEGARGLFGRHGKALGDGSYALCRIHWPACRDARANPSAG